MISDTSKFIVASHNNESVYKTMDYIEYLDSEEKRKFYKDRVFYATLYGLNDLLSY